MSNKSGGPTKFFLLKAGVPLSLRIGSPGGPNKRGGQNKLLIICYRTGYYYSDQKSNHPIKKMCTDEGFWIRVHFTVIHV